MREVNDNLGSARGRMGCDYAAELRHARRVWIAENHPDRGGDPDAFRAGLQDAAWLDDPRIDRPVRGPITAYRRGGGAAALRRLASRIERARRDRRRRRLRRVI
jgi:hypothetical protein